MAAAIVEAATSDASRPDRMRTRGDGAHHRRRQQPVTKLLIAFSRAVCGTTPAIVPALSHPWSVYMLVSLL